MQILQLQHFGGKFKFGVPYPGAWLGRDILVHQVIFTGLCGVRCQESSWEELLFVISRC